MPIQRRRAGDAEIRLATWAFDAVQQSTEQQNWDGTRTTLAYDLAGQLLGTRHTAAGGAVLDEALIAYDRVGNPLLKVTGDGRHTMTYDGANQLLSEDHPISGPKTWAYDPASNRTSQDWMWNGVRTLTEWTYDPADQLLNETTGAAVTVYTFDAAGNQQVVQAPTEVTTYQWDSENRLREIELPSGARNTMLYRVVRPRYQLSSRPVIIKCVLSPYVTE